MVTKKTNSEEDTFCILPFAHINSTNDGNFKVCCVSEEVEILDENNIPYNMRTHSIQEVWNSDFYKKLRKDLINGIKNPVCDQCWKLEETGAYSRRQKSLQEFKAYFDDFSPLVTEAIDNDYILFSTPKDLSLKIGNLCNLKCIMCFPGSSSLHQKELENMKSNNMQIPSMLQQWEKTVKEYNIDVEKFSSDSYDVESFIKNLDSALQTAEHISLVGGEPLINSATLELIRYCVDKKYADNLLVQIITNLTKVDHTILEQLNSFKHPMLNISYDHVDPAKFHYIRHPARYDRFLHNFYKLFEYKNIQKKLSTTWGIFNIFDYEEIFEVWEELARSIDGDFVVNMGMIYYPDYFNIKYLEEKQKDEVSLKMNRYLEKNNDYKIFQNNPELVQNIRAIREFMGPKPNNFQKVVTERTRVLRLYDSIRNTSYNELFPYIVDYD